MLVRRQDHDLREWDDRTEQNSRNDPPECYSGEPRCNEEINPTAAKVACRYWLGGSWVEIQPPLFLLRIPFGPDVLQG